MNPVHLKHLQDAYELPEITQVTEVMEGVLNKNYILETLERRYFCKHVRAKGVPRLPHTIAVEKYMSQAGIPAVCALPTKAGEGWMEVGGDTYTLYPFIQSDRSHTYTLEDSYRMGELLGRIHQVGSKNIPTNLTDRVIKEQMLDDAAEAIKYYRKGIFAQDSKNEIDDLFLMHLDAKERALPLVEMKTVLLSDTLTHGDYQAGNLLLHPDTREIIGVCDWEKSEMAPRSAEVARAVLYMSFEGKYRKNIEAAIHQARSFIDGYMSTNPITQEELKAGFRMRLRTHVYTSWLEDHYYNHGDPRGNIFLQHEIDIIEDFVFGNMTERVLD